MYQNHAIQSSDEERAGVWHHKSQVQPPLFPIGSQPYATQSHPSKEGIKKEKEKKRNGGNEAVKFETYRFHAAPVP
jgi:hypothetical protein